jgi:hypothetical protein
MRSIHALPLFAAILLGACGGSADEDGDGAISGEEVAAAVEDVVQPQPGQYRTTVEVLEFDVPGLTDQMKGQMQSMMSAGFAQGDTFCLTPEEAAGNGPQEMVENMAKSDCSFNKFDVSGGTISADMQCTGENGASSHMLMDGRMTETSSDMTMTMDQEMQGMGQMHMKMRVTSERTGDCA